MSSRSVVRVVVHMVWATSGRSPTLESGFDAWFARFAKAASEAHRCRLVAVGNACDHVHVLLLVSATASPLAKIAQALKGGSSHLWNQAHPDLPIEWQDGYWAESVDPNATTGLTEYVRDQRERHAAGCAPEPWSLTLFPTPV